MDVSDLAGAQGQALRELVREGSAALVNTATPISRTWNRVLFTVAAGSPAKMPANFHGIFLQGEHYPRHSSAAAVIYCRRTGYNIPLHRDKMVCPQFALLEHDHLAAKLPGALLAAGRSVLTVRFCTVTRDRVFSRYVATLAEDGHGVVTGTILSNSTSSPNAVAASILTGPPGLTVVSAASPGSKEGISGPTLAAELLHQSGDMSESCNVVLLGLTATPVVPLPAQWKRLTLLVLNGTSFHPGILYSPTTRTRGLASDTDVEPTVLHLLGLNVPSDMTGRPLEAVSNRVSADTVSYLRYMDRLALLNGAGSVAIMVPLALISLAVVSLCLFLQSTGKAKWQLTSWSLLSAQALPLALLIAPVLRPHTLAGYGLEIAAIMCVTGMVATVIAAMTQYAGTTVTTALFLLVLISDLVTGGTLVKNALLGGYALSGIRYYGVGNEYLGVVLGMVMFPLASLALSQKQHKNLKLGVAFASLLAALGWPGWGANAGSLIVCSVAATALLLPSNRRAFNFTSFVASLIIGLALAFVFAAADAWLGGPDVSHAGAALVSAAGPRGPSYLWQIIVRKIEMNLALSVSHWLLIAAAITAASTAVVWMIFKNRLRAVVTDYPDIALSWRALLWTMAAALITKDSGVVTVVFALGSATVVSTWVAACGALSIKAGSQQKQRPGQPAPGEESA